MNWWTWILQALPCILPKKMTRACIYPSAKQCPIVGPNMREQCLYTCEGLDNVSTLSGNLLNINIWRALWMLIVWSYTPRTLWMLVLWSYTPTPCIHLKLLTSLALYFSYALKRRKLYMQKYTEFNKKIPEIWMFNHFVFCSHIH